MTYQEILDEINAHAMTVRVLEEPHQGHVFLRVCYYQDVVNNIVRDEACNIIVPEMSDPTQPFGNMDAHYEKRLKYLITEPPFKTDLVARILQIQAAQSDFKFYDIISLDAEQEKSILTTYWLDTGKLVKKEYGAYRKSDGSIDFIEIA